MKTIITLSLIAIIGTSGYLLWSIGGVHLDYLQSESQSKALEICGEDSILVKQGYQRSMFGGFGGRVWWQCKIDNVWWEFAITRRIDNSQLQVYNLNQKTVFPNSFELK